MKIDHISLWVSDLEGMCAFYEKYFGAFKGDKYVNSSKNFTSYFLSFDSGCRLELMFNPNVPPNTNDVYNQNIGMIHFAISVGSKERVLALTDQIEKDGYEILGQPRTTGDGYFESVILDPENNRIEITI